MGSIKIYLNEALHKKCPPDKFILLFNIKVKAKKKEAATPNTKGFFKESTPILIKFFNYRNIFPLEKKSFLEDELSY